MSGVQIFKANRESDSALRAFSRSYASDGSFGFCMEREPNYFEALTVEGLKNDVIAVRVGDEIIGTSTRSEKACFVNGNPEPVMLGYLSSLRIAPPYQKTSVLARGYRFLKELHKAGGSKLYLTTIMGDNEKALEILTSRRAGLPAYEDFGIFYTYTLQPCDKVVSRLSSDSSLSISLGSTEDAGEIIGFIHGHGPRRQFYPAYTEEMLVRRDGLLKGLSHEHVFLARKNGKLIGTLALWDQSSFRQRYIRSYSRLISTLRPLYNLYASLTSHPLLPKAGQRLDYRFVAMLCIADDDLKVFSSLFAAALNHLFSSKPDPQVHISLHERDPLRHVLEALPHFRTKSRLFVVHWDDGEQEFRNLTDLVPYIEPGAL